MPTSLAEAHSRAGRSRADRFLKTPQPSAASPSRWKTATVIRLTRRCLQSCRREVLPSKRPPGPRYTPINRHPSICQPFICHFINCHPFTPLPSRRRPGQGTLLSFIILSMITLVIGQHYKPRDPQQFFQRLLQQQQQQCAATENRLTIFLQILLLPIPLQAKTVGNWIGCDHIAAHLAAADLYISAAAAAAAPTGTSSKQPETQVDMRAHTSLVSHVSRRTSAAFAGD